MKKAMKKSLAAVLALAMTAGMLTACGDTTASVSESTSTDSSVSETVTDPADEYWCDEFDVMSLSSKEYGTDYTSLYEAVGKDITIADVTEDPDTGFAYITVDGEQHLLGLDFLSMAMVYNDEPAGEYETTDDVYAAWWRLYITRWNYLMPEVPLYSNEYYDVYNTEIGGVEEHPTNPYWDPADALIDWTSAKADNDIIIGSVTELSGKFRYSSFGSSNPGASDLDVQTLTTGLDTVAKTKEGGYTWNDTVVAAHDEVVNDDGSKTFTITLKEGLKFSDGSEVTADDYLAFPMAFNTVVATEASGYQVQSLSVLGQADYLAYTGPDSTEGTKVFAGLHKIDDYTFSVTIAADYIPYFYDITYASFSAYYAPMFLGDAEILDDGDGCYLSDSFYAKNDDGSYVVADQIGRAHV